MIPCNGEEFTFHTRGIVLEIPIPENAIFQARNEPDGPVNPDKQINEIKQEFLDGLHVIEHVLQHSGVTIANISHDNLDGIYENEPSPGKFKKIYKVRKN